MADKTHDRLIERFHHMRSFAYQYRQHYEHQWRENYQGYMNMRPRPEIPNEFWTKRTRVPDEFKIIETIMPQHVLNMYRSKDWFSVFAPTSSGQTYESIVKRLLLSGWSRADMITKSITGVKSALIQGHLIAKVFWDVQVGPREVLVTDQDFTGDQMPTDLKRVAEDQVTFNGPQVTFPDLFDVYLDPTGRDEWAIERIPQSIELMKRKNSEFGDRLYDPKALRKLSERNRHQPPHPHTHRGLGVSPYDVQDAINYVEGVPEQRQDDEVDTWEWWTWMPPEIESYDDSQWRKILIADDNVVLSNVRAPSPDLRHPFISIPAIPIPGRIYGASVLNWVQELIDLRQFIEDARREEVVQKLWQPMVVDENSSLSPEELFRKPGGALFMSNNTGRLSDSILFPNQGDVMASSYQESAVKDEQISTTSGATNPFEGQPAGGRTTATEISIISQLGTGRFQLATMWFDEMLKGKILKKMFNLYKTRMTQEELVETQAGGERFRVDFRTLMWDVDIHVDSGLFGSMDAQMLQAYLQLYGIFANNPVANQRLKHGEIIKDAFTRAGDWRALDHVKTEDEVARENQEAMEQQQQLQQQEGQIQAELDTNRELARGFASALGRGGEGGGAEGGLG